MKGKKGIVWFRQDLRLHDNEALHDALLHCDEILPVYVFDERVFNGKTKFGFPKTGIHRTNFILESIAELKQNLQSKGSDLIIRIGKPEEEIFKIARVEKTSWVFCNRERTEEEVKVQDDLEKKLWSVGQEVRFSRGKMLFYTADLPFPVTHTPDNFTHFRKEVEKFIPIRKTWDTELRPLPALNVRVEIGETPSLSDFGFKNKYVRNPKSAFPFKGGENAAISHLKNYFWEKELAKTYKESRNQMMGTDFSTKFSPWLAHGCISPKKIYWELKKYEEEKGANESTYWIFFELMWRDFFRLMGKKHENNIFKKGGPKQANLDFSEDKKRFRIWAEGRTGIPFIDANMIELNETGFMSNRGRQNVASFLCHDLNLNWQLGAEYFESQLIDYDPCSNYGNWNYIAGIGSDPRENRKFNVLSQAIRYDENGQFVKHWIPVLNEIPSDLVHKPWLLSSEQQKAFQLTIGKDYPAASPKLA